MSMTREAFRKRWGVDNEGGITHDEIADCAKAWGLFSTPRTKPMDEVVDRVLAYAGVSWSEEPRSLDDYEDGEPPAILAAAAPRDPEPEPQDDEPIGNLPAPEFQMAKRSIYEIRRDLSQRFPRFEKTKEQGGATLTFIPWYEEVRLLGHYTNHHWDYEVVIIETVQQDVDLPVLEYSEQKHKKVPTGERIVKRDTWIRVKVRLTIHAIEGTFHYDGTGFESMDKNSYGDPQSTAESMALRRAATKTGLGLYLYQK